jgi:hypothetical protein
MGSFMELSFDDAIRFLRTKTADAKCPFCGSSGWLVPFKNEDADKVYLDSANQVRGGQEIFTLSVECRNCAFLRTHSASAIADWLKANPEDSSDEQL